MKKEVFYEIIDIKEDYIIVKLNKKTLKYPRDKFIYKPEINQKVIALDNGLFITEDKYNKKVASIMILNLIIKIVAAILIIILLYHASGCAACNDDFKSCATIG